MKPKGSLLVWILGVYVILQFFWWGYLMIDLTRHSAIRNSVISGRIMMIVGEGTVFLVILSFGLWRIQSAIRKEMKLFRQQQNFTLSVTHELKTPVAAAKLYLQTLLKRDLPPEKREEIMQKALNEMARLELLTEQVLTAARLDDGKYALHVETFSFHSFLNELLASFRVRTTMPLQLTEFSDFQVTTDRNMLHTVINNLLENALKYAETPDGVRIEVAASQRGFAVRIRDFGPGVNPEHRAEIFRKFIRLENEETRSSKGTGLGLYIASEFMKVAGGQLRLLPVEGKGACFELQMSYG